MSNFHCLRCVTPAKCGIHGCCPGTWPAEEPQGATPCQECYGKGWNDEWKANDHYNGGEVFRIDCSACEATGRAR